MKKKTYLSLIALIMSCCSLSAQSTAKSAGNPDAKPVVKVLVTNSDAMKGILKLNDSLFLVSTDDIKSLSSDIMTSFGLYNPGTAEFDAFLKENGIKPEGITFIFYATTRPNAKIPEKFTVK